MNFFNNIYSLKLIMSFIKELENIRECAEKEIIELAKKTFEDILIEHLRCAASRCSNEGSICVSIEKKEWYINFKYILDSSKLPSNYYNINSDDVFEILIKHIRSNSKFDGVELDPDFIRDKIYFSWNLSQKDISITKELHELFEAKKTFIINEVKNAFNNSLREEMKIVAKKGVRKGNFYFDYSDCYILKNILKTDKLCKWLINHTLKEQKDLAGIKIDDDDRYTVYFSW